MTETRSADENYSVVEPWPCARNWTVLVAEVAIDCESTPSSLSSVRSRRTEASADSSYAACERCPTSGHCSAPPTTSSSSSAEQRRPIPSRHPARGWLLAGQPSEQCPQALPLLRSPEPLPGHPPSRRGLRAIGSRAMGGGALGLLGESLMRDRLPRLSLERALDGPA